MSIRPFTNAPDWKTRGTLVDDDKMLETVHRIHDMPPGMAQTTEAAESYWEGVFNRDSLFVCAALLSLPEDLPPKIPKKDLVAWMLQKQFAMMTWKDYIIMTEDYLVLSLTWLFSAFPWFVRVFSQLSHSYSGAIPGLLLFLWNVRLPSSITQSNPGIFLVCLSLLSSTPRITLVLEFPCR
jgi:hypothetical protein